ncbi:nucleotide sugar dehydrogenase [Amycolatopsis acidicola]|uniref:Nucleotide sugar dehydrogenase n=1 Tax=Amycolatopsis acidicola TaxID=2596893 RepID=A0A5N0V667_9PSEU|nr:nucleotide sugar dehydrogenase [Amycolatopsis acidicola]
MGYVGLPTALALHESGARTTGLDVSAERLGTIASGEPDLVEADRERLSRARGDTGFTLTTDQSSITEADAVIICVPTPLDEHLGPELSPLRAACRAVVEQARLGQVLILTSTSFVGTTRQLLAEPLAERGFTVGEDVFVAFSPERIDPGHPEHTQRATPRVVGGSTWRCAEKARAVLELLTPSLHVVSSAEAAELTKLYENSFRAVNIALANEFAGICGTLSLDPVEVTKAAATKPYGFMPFYPGPGVGGHCIPCDPQYLLWQLRAARVTAPLVDKAMTLIADRPRHVVTRALETLSAAGRGLAGARVVVIGVSYKPGVADLRESSALEIITGLLALGAKVDYHDPMVGHVLLRGGRVLENVPEPHGAEWDLALVHTVHPGYDYDWVRQCPIVLDATYTFTAAPGRALV